MARLPNIKRPDLPRAEYVAPSAPSRSMADLPPSVGYLQGEIERLPVAGPISGNEEFPVLQGGKAKRGSTRSLIKLIRQEANDVAETAANLAIEGGGSGRHSLVRSITRARPLASLDGSEVVGLIREGNFYRVPVSLLMSGGEADTLEGHAGAYFLDWANFTGVPTTFPPSAHTHAQSEVTDLVSDLAAKAPLASPAFTGNPTAPTQAAGNNSTRIATTAYTDAAIAALIASAPGVLDTLDEIAAALGDDPDFAATMTTALAGKLVKSSNLSDLTNAATARTNLGVAIGTDVVAQSHVGAGGPAHANAVAAGAAGFMTGADKTKLDGIASGADVTSATNIGTAVNGTTTKTTPVDADAFGVLDSAASNILKKLTWANLKATLKTYFDGIYSPLAPAFAGIPDVIIEDQKARGTSGGGATSGSFFTRDLTTIVRNNGAIASLSANEVTLGAGTYYFEWSAPAYRVGPHQTLLLNVTDGTRAGIGTSEYSSSTATDASPTRSIGSAVVTIAASKAFNISHYVTTTKTADGCGVATDITTSIYEVYSRLEITKLS